MDLCSGTSTGSGSIPHSFSVDDIQNMRVKLKSSKSYAENQLLRPDSIEEVDNSSSGVSSDQEMTMTNNVVVTDAILGKVYHQTPSTMITTSTALHHHKPQQQMRPLSVAQKNNVAPIDGTKSAITTAVGSDDDDDDKRVIDVDDADDSPSPPPKSFQRHNSLTRKQAANIAIGRAMQTRSAVSLLKLPPPIEADHEIDGSLVPSVQSSEKVSSSKRCDGLGRSHSAADGPNATTENLVLAPPPQFCDCINAPVNGGRHGGSGVGHNSNSNTLQRVEKRNVRIVGTVPKVNNSPL